MAPSENDPQSKPSEREAKLAQALRANLRRRKATDRAPMRERDPAKNEGKA